MMEPRTSRAYAYGMCRDSQSYLIFYRDTAEGVVIERVLHGARDLKRLLRKDQ